MPRTRDLIILESRDIVSRRGKRWELAIRAMWGVNTSPTVSRVLNAVLCRMRIGVFECQLAQFVRNVFFEAYAVFFLWVAWDTPFGLLLLLGTRAGGAMHVVLSV